MSNLAQYLRLIIDWRDKIWSGCTAQRDFERAWYLKQIYTPIVEGDEEGEIVTGPLDEVLSSLDRTRIDKFCASAMAEVPEALIPSVNAVNKSFWDYVSLASRTFPNDAYCELNRLVAELIPLALALQKKGKANDELAIKLAQVASINKASYREAESIEFERRQEVFHAWNTLRELGWYRDLRESELTEVRQEIEKCLDEDKPIDGELQRRSVERTGPPTERELLNAISDVLRVEDVRRLKAIADDNLRPQVRLVARMITGASTESYSVFLDLFKLVSLDTESSVADAIEDVRNLLHPLKILKPHTEESNSMWPWCDDQRGRLLGKSAVNGPLIVADPYRAEVRDVLKKLPPNPRVFQIEQNVLHAFWKSTEPSLELAQLLITCVYHVFRGVPWPQEIDWHRLCDDLRMMFSAELTSELQEVAKVEYSGMQDEVLDFIAIAIEKVRQSHSEVAADELGNPSKVATDGMDDAVPHSENVGGALAVDEAQSDSTDAATNAIEDLPTKQRIAYASFELAQHESESELEDRQAYDYLSENGHLSSFYLDKQPSFGAWSRNLRRARKALGKQKKSPTACRTTKSVVRSQQI